MTKLNITSYKDLIAAKTAIINYHKGDQNAYTREAIARDACFTSHNSMQWKALQMAEALGEIRKWREDNPDAEVIDVAISKKKRLYDSMEQEHAELEERHKADREVHKAIVGKEWKPQGKRDHSSDKLGELHEIDKMLAS